MEFWALCPIDTWKKKPSLSMERLEQGQNEHVSKGCQGGGTTGAWLFFRESRRCAGGLDRVARQSWNPVHTEMHIG